MLPAGDEGYGRNAGAPVVRVDVPALLAAAAVTASAWVTIQVDRMSAVLLSVAIAIAASLARRPVLLAVASVLFVGSNAADQLRALDADPPRNVAGTALLVGDPLRSDFGWQVLVSVDDRRYAASADAEDGWILSSLATGDHVQIEGRSATLDDAPTGWVRSNHLAGRLVVRSMQRGPPAAPWYRLANGVRRVLADGSRSFDPERRPLYLGMVVGDDRGLSDLRQYRFRAAGLTHLSAVSGQNVGFVLLLFSPVLTRTRSRLRWLPTSAVLVFFVLVTRADPSVLRAAVMAAVAVLAMSRGRPVRPTRALALAVVALLSADPMMVHSLGFALSVVATLSLVVVAPSIAGGLPGPTWLRAPLAVTLAAHLATAPILASIGSQASPWAVPANLVAVPVAGAVMVLGMTLGLLSGLVAEPFAAVLQAPCRLAVGWVDLVASIASSAPSPRQVPASLVVAAWIGTALISARARARSHARARAHVSAADPGDDRHTSVGSRFCPNVRRRLRGGLIGLLALLSLVVMAGTASVDRPIVGVRRPSTGLDVAVGPCRGVIVRVGARAQGTASLAALSAIGVRRVDVLVVGPGAGRVGAHIGEQWPVRRRVFEGPGSDGLHLEVGGAAVDLLDGRSQIGLSDRPCRFGT